MSNTTIEIENPLQNLHEKIIYLIQNKDFKITKEKNQRILSEAIKKIAQNGFLRTHAFLHNWLREFFEEGELTSKSLLNIRSSLPWSWDQTKKYFDALERNKVLIYSRDSIGKKICTLTITDHLGEGVNSIPTQELRLFYYLKYQKNIPTDEFANLKSRIGNYYSKLENFEQMKSKVEKEKEKFQSTEMNHIKLLAEEIATFYWHNRTKKGIVNDIEEMLVERPTTIFSLEYR